MNLANPITAANNLSAKARPPSTNRLAKPPLPHNQLSNSNSNPTKHHSPHTQRNNNRRTSPRQCRVPTYRVRIRCLIQGHRREVISRIGRRNKRSTRRGARMIFIGERVWEGGGREMVRGSDRCVE